MYHESISFPARSFLFSLEAFHVHHMSTEVSQIDFLAVLTVFQHMEAVRSKFSKIKISASSALRYRKSISEPL